MDEMDFDFSQIINRRGTDALKWRVGENELPMWVADMDFKTAPAVTEAVIERAKHGVFGYTVIPDEYYEAVSGWWAKRHGFAVQKEWVIFCTGVVPALSSIVRKLTTPGENVLIQPPVYNIFYNCVLNNGRNVLANDLLYDGKGYSIDFDDLEKLMSVRGNKLYVLCNPHNPTGKVWGKEDLERLAELLCRKYRVTVVSDEIHCDIVKPGLRYVPFASVSEEDALNSVTCVSPSKAFNLAGLQSASVIVPDKTLRHKVNRALNTDEIAEPNVFAATAATAAFTKGEKWLDAACEYIQANKDYAAAFIREKIPPLFAAESEATYLLWIDCTRLTDAAGFTKRLRKATGLFLSDGAVYGGNGRGFVRMNLACPEALMREGLKRLRDYTN